LMFEPNRFGVSDRKLCLSACAYCRLMWEELPHDGCRRFLAMLYRMPDA
jgi:hypothetical protein